MANTEQGFKEYIGPNFSTKETKTRAAELRSYLDQRRSLRFYSDKKVEKSVITDLIMTASSAPSGAHKQPWTFCAVEDPLIKKEIRKAAEKEEYENYHGRMSDKWLEDLAPFGTDWYKEFLEVAPWLIIMFKKAYDMGEDGKKHKNYYVNESVGIAAGFLINAIHHAGLVTLTHTPSPMNFLQKILDRPDNERAFLLLPVGYPQEGAEVPILERKRENEVIRFY